MAPNVFSVLPEWVRKHWRFNTDPFGDHCDLYLGSPQREMIASVCESIIRGEPISVVHAREHCGVSRLFHHLSGFHGFGDVATECTLLNLNQATSTDNQECLIDSSQSSVRQVWFVDCDEGALTSPLLRQMNHTHVSIVVAARRPVSLTSSHRITLSAFDQYDTRGFLDAALVQAGRHDSVFSDSAVNLIHLKSEGLVGRIVPLANRMLAVAAEEHAQHVHGCHYIDLKHGSAKAA